MTPAVTMPPNSCTNCGDGTEPGRELCSMCEYKRDLAALRKIPGDNYRASVRFPKSRYHR